MGATLFGATGIQARELTVKRNAENLAYLYQQILTVIVRVRLNRQTLSDMNAFRSNIQSGLRAAEKESAKRGYPADDVRMATFAAVAFLDESVLSSANSAFVGWQSRPLQEEMFGHHVGGETFFENLEKLMSRPDSHEAADILELYVLCLLLGYRGRYGLSVAEATRPLIDSAMEKIRRVRGPLAGLSPAWAVPDATVAILRRDPWAIRLLYGTLIAVSLAILVFVIFKLRLASDASLIHAIILPAHQ